MKTYSEIAICLLFAALPWSGCQEQTAADEQPTLYTRLGGLPAIVTVVDTLTQKMIDNPQTSPFFATSDIPRFKALLVEMICEASEGPCSYSGRPIKMIHAGMGVGDAAFDAMMAEVAATFSQLGVPAAEGMEVMQILGLQRGNVVNVPPAP